ncbi:bone morphogenetic protein 2-like [Bacillus rossius redtenbacheri]|uniref:bone morphogenetic protein 2-like n=1 Tax=Bacillus rossius redtenbacheri TaxID=93214 RepID=UPI002FDD75DC
MHAGAATVAWWLAALALAAARGGPADREQALSRLQEVFGLPGRDARPHGRHEAPPQFMTELYDAVAGPSGLARGSSPYDAEVVRSFIERDNSHEQFFFFNITGLDPGERVLEAELHLFRVRAPPKEAHRVFPSSPDCLLHVYQVLDSSALSQPDLQRLLSVHYISRGGSGWLVVNVKQAVLDWVGGRRPNLGLLVVASDVFGQPVALSVARRGRHYGSKQPVLVLFDDYGRRPPETSASGSGPGPADKERAAGWRARRSLSVSTEESPRGESPRAPDNINSSVPECSRYPLYVNFSEIGWDSWIVAPEGYMAHQCKGPCDFPLGQGQAPTNHATVQSIMHELKEGVAKPCCVPTSLASFAVLYLDDQMNVVLKKYEDMVAEGCGCQ